MLQSACHSIPFEYDDFRTGFDAMFVGQTGKDARD
jgi:hypothetical protein